MRPRRIDLAGLPDEDAVEDIVEALLDPDAWFSVDDHFPRTRAWMARARPKVSQDYLGMHLSQLLQQTLERGARAELGRQPWAPAVPGENRPFVAAALLAGAIPFLQPSGAVTGTGLSMYAIRNLVAKEIIKSDSPSEHIGLRKRIAAVAGGYGTARATLHRNRKTIRRIAGAVWLELKVEFESIEEHERSRKLSWHARWVFFRAEVRGSLRELRVAASAMLLGTTSKELRAMREAEIEGADRRGVQASPNTLLVGFRPTLGMRWRRREK